MRCQPPAWDTKAAAWVMGETKHHVVQILPMIYNHRVVLVPKNDPYCYDVGWCYPNFTKAMRAVLAWDLATQTEPRGYIKRIDWMIPEGAPQRELV